MEANYQQNASGNIQLSVSVTPGHTHAGGLTDQSASRASDLLNLNHNLYHTRFNGGFHSADHITHHLLALWALGASSDELQAMWDFNKPYQAPIEQHDTPICRDLDLKDPVIFDRCLGKDECYADFMRFFEDRIGERGVPDVIREYVLKGDARANEIFCRMYTDLVHPIIHLGYAIEFQQPSLVAEALAAACIHDNWPKDFLLPTEDFVRSDTPSKSLLQILDDIRHDPEILSAVQDTDPFNKVRDGLLKRVTGKQLAPYLSQFQVKPTLEDMQSKMTEMMHTSAYVMGAAQRPGKCEAMDFVLLHSVTLMVFYPAILTQEWLSDHDKCRLLEAKARVDIVLYAACRSPELHPARIVDYVPRNPQDGWAELFRRSITHHDEGHVVKVIRALFSLEELGETVSGFPIAKSDFVTIAHMAVDSVERAFEPDGHNMPENVADAVIKQVGQGGEMVVTNMVRWVFYGGLEKAWQYVPDSKRTAKQSC